MRTATTPCAARTLVRELTFIVDAHDYAWAKRIKRLLLDACHHVANRDDKTLTPDGYKALQRRYRTVLTPGRTRAPTDPPPTQRPARSGRQVRCPQPVGATENP